jgi:hypothetical protein
VKRTAFRRRTEGPTATREPKPWAKAAVAEKPKTKPCAYDKCGRQFVPMKPMQQVCGPRCAGRMVKARAAEKKAAEKAATRAQRERMKTRGDLTAEAQDAFNAYIRFRDAGLPCVDCGKPFEPQKLGGSMDAGHYLARSVAPHLRFMEDNVAGQRKNCNRPGGTTRSAFRAGLVARIGEERVRALETDHTPRDEYRARLRAMKKQAKE